MKEAEEFNRTLPHEIRFPNYKINSGEVSPLVSTKEISQPLSLNLSTTLLDSSTIDLDFGELNLEDIETEQEQIAQIQITPNSSNN